MSELVATQGIMVGDRGEAVEERKLLRSSGIKLWGLLHYTLILY